MRCLLDFGLSEITVWFSDSLDRRSHGTDIEMNSVEEAGGSSSAKRIETPDADSRPEKEAERKEREQGLEEKKDKKDREDKKIVKEQFPRDKTQYAPSGKKGRVATAGEISRDR